MLRAIIKTNHLRKKEHKLPKEMVENIEWLLKETDVLADQRNGALHAVYSILDEDGALSTTFLPFTKRSTQMHMKKDPLAEIIHYREKAQVLGKFAGLLAFHKDEIPSGPNCRLDLPKSRDSSMQKYLDLKKFVGLPTHLQGPSRH